MEKSVLPTHWYNILPDLPESLPEPIGGEEALAVMIPSCLAQEFSNESWIEIPEELREKYYPKIGRPRPIFRAEKLEKKLQTPAELYYKAESFSPTGSHKLNTAIAQAYYAKKDGFEKLVTETGAGQWGTALAFAAKLMGLESLVYWVRAAHSWKEQRRKFMEAFGAQVFASPTYDPDNPGSLSIAISEGLEAAAKDENAVYALGSVLNHVLLHQTIIGLEAQKQMEELGCYPDVIISCLGGGSNFGGLALPFFGDVLKKGKKIKFIAAQSEAAANLQGEYRYNFADYQKIAPQLKMYTLGHQATLEPIRADGIRYHGCSPILSLLKHLGYIDTIAYPTNEKHVFEGAKLFFETEGPLPSPVIVPEAGINFPPLTKYKAKKVGWPAPESSYSIACAIDEAIRCRESNEKKVILFNISGHGFLDMQAYKEVLGI